MEIIEKISHRNISDHPQSDTTVVNAHMDLKKRKSILLMN